MDNITHTLVGLFLSRAGLNRLTPLATPLLLVSANLPDIDLITAVGGATNYFHYHRHLTHSLAVAPILALALAAAFRAIRPSIGFVPVFFVALCGVASHLLLDWTNIYGIRLLLPFRGTWFHLDLTPVIDYWIWAAFALALAGPFLANLVNSEIGQRRASGSGRGFAIAALLFVVFYDGGRAALHARVLGMLDAREYAGAPALRTAAFPASMNPLKWHGLVESDSAYRLFEIALPAGFDPSLAEIIGKAAPSEAINVAAKTEPFRVMTDFALYPIYRVTPRPDRNGGVLVELSDLRFSFTSAALVNRQNQVEKSSFQFGPPNFP